MSGTKLIRLLAVAAIALVLGLSPVYAGCGVCGENESDHSHAPDQAEAVKGSSAKGSATKAPEGNTTKSATERKIDPNLPTVVFYKLPVCGVCAQVDKWLAKLDKQNKGAANFVRKDATDKKNSAELKARGIKHHGVAILYPTTNVLWAAEGHGLQQKTLKKAFTKHVTSKTLSVAGEVGCAACIFKLPGHSGCSVGAVEINGQTYVLSGKTIDVHGSGLCKKAKTAHLQGKFTESTFVASDVGIE